MEKHYFGLKEAKAELSPRDIKEPEFLHKELSQINKSENEVKKRIALFCLNLVEKTDKREMTIHKTSHIISEFTCYSFNDKFDEILRISRELAKPIHKTSQKELFTLWEKMKELLRTYTINISTK